MNKHYSYVFYWLYKFFAVGLLLGSSLVISGCIETLTYVPPIPNPYYDPILPSQAYPGAPEILFDVTHNNFHQISGRYMGLASLARADGYQVRELTTPFPSGCQASSTWSPPSTACDQEYKQALKRADILVLPHPGTSISVEEAKVLLQWVHNKGGSLLIITDHPPFYQGFSELLKGINLEVIYDPSKLVSGPERNTQWSWAEHPIVTGGGQEEVVNNISAAFKVYFKKDSQSSWNAVDPPAPSFVIADVYGLARVAVLQWGAGRVVVVGDGRLFWSQHWLHLGIRYDSLDCRQFNTFDMAEEYSNISINGCLKKIISVSRLKYCEDEGISAEQCETDKADKESLVGIEQTDNQKFVLNIFHWLSRLSE